jgi:hypothetical protein
MRRSAGSRTRKVGVLAALVATVVSVRAGAQESPPGGPLPPLPSQSPPPAYAPPPAEYAPPPAYGAPPRVYAMPPRPPDYEPESPTHAPKFSLWVGGRVGFTGYGGAFYTNEQGESETTGNFVRTGPEVQIDVGARLGKRYVPFFFYERALVGVGHRFEGDDASAYSELKGFGFRHTGGDVDSAGFLSELSVGQRTVAVSNAGSTYKMSTFEFFKLGLGAEIRVSTLFVLSPLASIATGVMSDAEGTVPFSRAGSGDGLTRPRFAKANGAGTTIDDQRTYLVLSIGIGGHFDVFGK